MSEFFDEYTHIVADPRKPWPYFDIPSCLKMLSWSVDECCGRIYPRWSTKDGFTRHAVVQLALYTCPPFSAITPGQYLWISETEGYIEGYIIDQPERGKREQKQRKYPCRSVIALVEALATALMHYESACEQGNWWPSFQRDVDSSIQFLRGFPRLRENASRRGHAPQHQKLWHNKRLPKEVQSVIDAIEAFTYEDYQHTNAPTNEPSDPRTHGRKHCLLKEMEEAFHTYMPEDWPHMATCRALAAIMNQMQITNAKGKQWSAGSIKRFLRRGPDPRLGVTITIRRQNIVPWYTRPE
jgi:hypothetical protein